MNLVRLLKNTHLLRCATPRSPLGKGERGVIATYGSVRLIPHDFARLAFGCF